MSSRTQPAQNIATVAITAEGALDVLAPTRLLIQPIATQPQADAGVAGLHLRTLHGDELVEILVEICRLTCAAVFVVIVGDPISNAHARRRRWM